MFRFTIRDVLWLTVVVGMAVAWWVDHRTAAKLQEELYARENSLSLELAVFREREPAATPSRP